MTSGVKVFKIICFGIVFFVLLLLMMTNQTFRNSSSVWIIKFSEKTTSSKSKTVTSAQMELKSVTSAEIKKVTLADSKKMKSEKSQKLKAAVSNNVTSAKSQNVASAELKKGISARTQKVIPMEVNNIKPEESMKDALSKPQEHISLESKKVTDTNKAIPVKSKKPSLAASKKVLSAKSMKVASDELMNVASDIPQKLASAKSQKFQTVESNKVKLSGFNKLTSAESKKYINKVAKVEEHDQPFVAASPLGRLGNQLFELASLIAFAEMFDYRPAFIVNHTFESKPFFKIPNFTLIASKESNFHNIGDSSFCAYDPENYVNPNRSFPAGRNISLGGYRQNYKYFQHQELAVRKYLRFSDSIWRECQHKLEDLMNISFGGENQTTDLQPVLIGIHTRRGDFVTATDGRIASSAETITNMLDLIIENSTLSGLFSNNSVKFILIGEDYDWNRNFAKLYNSKRLNGTIGTENFPNFPTILVPAQGSPAVDMCLLSQCRHVVLTAATTFGWWSAFLAGPGKTVFYPENLFKNGSSLMKRIKNPKCGSYFMEDWIKLKA